MRALRALRTATCRRRSNVRKSRWNLAARLAAAGDIGAAAHWALQRRIDDGRQLRHAETVAVTLTAALLARRNWRCRQRHRGATQMAAAAAPAQAAAAACSAARAVPRSRGGGGHRRISRRHGRRSRLSAAHSRRHALSRRRNSPAPHITLASNGASRSTTRFRGVTLEPHRGTAHAGFTRTCTAVDATRQSRYRARGGATGRRRTRRSRARAATAPPRSRRKRRGKAASARASRAGRAIVSRMSPRTGPGGAACAPASCRGTGRCSGPTPIPTFSITRSGPTAMTTASGTMPMTISSTACSGAKMARRRTTPMRAPAARTRVSYAGVQELCKQPGTGITAWPFAEIERKVGLNDEQKQLLGDVRKAAADAAATFKASCPAENTFPLTPPGRLTAMTGAAAGDARRRADRAARARQVLQFAQRRAEGTLQRARPQARCEQCRDGRRPAAGQQELLRGKTRPRQSADREDRGRGQADRRAGRRPQAVAGRHRQGGLAPASGLSGGHAAHPARTAGRRWRSACKP